MSCYISTNDNRFYVQTETGYGVVPATTAANRIPAVKLSAKQVLDKVTRRDKTGGRTYPGLPTGVRSRTNFRLRTYLTAWGDPAAEPGYGPLFTSAMGEAGLAHGGAAVSQATGTTLEFLGPHGMLPGQAVAYGGEIRFVSALVDARTVILNAPFSGLIVGGATTSPTMTYRLGDRPKSTTIFDYWSPGDAVQRVLYGAIADEMKIKVNADLHEFEFAGPAADLLDSTSFVSGVGGLTEFPLEPPAAEFDYTVIPGHLGQVWMGVAPERFYTLTEAQIALKNDVDLRADEFGRMTPACFTAGTRDASISFSLYETGDEATHALYQAGRQRTPIAVMFQLGQAQGQLFGAYLKSVVPVVPEFDDAESRLRWSFANCRAEGGDNDELVVAFA